MVLEQEIPRFAAWIGPALLAFLLTAGVVILAVALIAWLVQALVCGPLAAGDRVYRGVLTGLADLRAISPGRVWALARLAVQEAVRRNVLLVLGVFAVVILFAGWFLDPTNVDPGRLYLGFMLGATNLLVCAVTLILAVFSLPSDIKSKAIQTVTTKPVRPVEIVLGRFLVVGDGHLAPRDADRRLAVFVVRVLAIAVACRGEAAAEAREPRGDLGQPVGGLLGRCPADPLPNGRHGRRETAAHGEHGPRDPAEHGIGGEEQASQHDRRDHDRPTRAGDVRLREQPAHRADPPAGAPERPLHPVGREHGQERAGPRHRHGRAPAATAAHPARAVSAA